jgi:hypothetical protein
MFRSKEPSTFLSKNDQIMLYGVQCVEEKIQYAINRFLRVKKRDSV